MMENRLSATMRLFTSALSLSLLTAHLMSCGYHTGMSSTLKPYRTVSIPYVAEDPNGLLTAQLAKQISTQGSLRYQASSGDLLLRIQLHDSRDYAIGFRYDRDMQGKYTKDIGPTESRLKQQVTVCLVEAATGNCLLGPTMIEANVEYDYQSSLGQGPLLQQTLGQIDQALPATEYAQYSLHEKLAQAIAHFIYHSA